MNTAVLSTLGGFSVSLLNLLAAHPPGIGVYFDAVGGELIVRNPVKKLSRSSKPDDYADQLSNKYASYYPRSYFF
jgi:hypothetical protein